MRAADSSEQFLKSFSDPKAAAQYADGPPRFVPGMDGLHRMCGVLLQERAPEHARVLVVGAGGGLELKFLAETQPTWTFVGVDPAAEMLRAAERLLGPLNERVELINGYIEDVPSAPFDAATCLLTLHFLDPDDRLHTATEIRGRLKPQAPFVAAHCSFPQAATERDLWLNRYAAYAISSGIASEIALSARTAVAGSLRTMAPEFDEALLREAGFKGVALFYAAFTWRGWCGYA